MTLDVENLNFKQEIKGFSFLGSKVAFMFAQLLYTDDIYSNKPFIFLSIAQDYNVAVTIMTEKSITKSLTYKYNLIVAFEK